MTEEGRLPQAATADALIARLESVPFSRWHLRPRVVVGTATFFDAFDALSPAFVLPVLVPLWGLGPADRRSDCDRLSRPASRRGRIHVAAEGIRSVFLMFAGVAIVGALAATRMLETGNRRLEDIAA